MISADHLLLLAGVIGSLAMLLEIRRAAGLRHTNQALGEHLLIVRSSLLAIAIALALHGWAQINGMRELADVAHVMLAAAFVPLTIYMLAAKPIAQLREDAHR